MTDIATETIAVPRFDSSANAFIDRTVIVTLADGTVAKSETHTTTIDLDDDLPTDPFERQVSEVARTPDNVLRGQRARAKGDIEQAEGKDTSALEAAMQGTDAAVIRAARKALAEAEPVVREARR